MPIEKDDQQRKQRILPEEDKRQKERKEPLPKK